MAIGYSKPTWTNGSGTAISAANLQALSDATKIMADACDSGASATATKIWNDKNDGNAGQPPAPKPRSATDSDIGQLKRLVGGTGGDCVLPSGGTWAWVVTTYTSGSPSTYYQMAAGVSAGGSTVAAAIAGKFNDGFCWRVA